MSRRGFTLAEIMIAVAILAFIGLLTYGAFGNSLSARDRALEVAERYHEIRQAMNRMAREISMAFLSHHRMCDDPRSKTIFKHGSAGGGESLTFTSFSHIKMTVDANESDQNVLSYYIETDPHDRSLKSLMRRVKHRIDEYPEDGGEEQVLLRDVTKLSFEFYNDRDDDWRNDWDSDSMDYRHRLPLYVAIAIEARGPHGRLETFATKTEVFLRRVGAAEDALLFFGIGARRCPD